MWAYYAGVVVVGIGFLTLGLGWTLLGLSLGCGLYIGVRHRAEAAAKLGDLWTRVPEFYILKYLFRRKRPEGQRMVEQTPRRWMFPEPKLSDIRREGFDALSESFLLLKRLVPYYSAALFEYDADTRLAYPQIYSTGSDGFRKDVILSVSDGVVGYGLSSGKIVHYSDFKGDARLLGYYSTAEDIRSVICIPLDRAERRLGALVLDSKAPAAFSAKMDEIRHVSNIFSDLLVRVQREETFVVRLEEDRTLKAMTERMAKAGASIGDVAESLCTLAKDVFPADRVTFVVFDDPSAAHFGNAGVTPESLKNSPIVRFRSLKMLDRYVELVARTRKTLRLDDLWENGLLSLATGQTGLTTRGMLAAPFVFDSHVVGVVLLEADRRRAFNAFHETAIGELVTHAATAVARAIEYGRMEKTCAIADVVPAAADRIFSEPALEPAADLLKERFGAAARVYEVIAPKGGDLRLRLWDDPDAEEVAPSPFQKNSIETGAALVRVEGKVTPIKEAAGELPAGADVVFPLASGSHTHHPFGLFCLSLRSPLRAESLHILDRVRALIQIRLVLERRERQFGFLKVRDPLTGIFHTAAFEKRLDERLRLARQASASFHLLLIQPGRMYAIKRSHGFAESVRRYTALCSEVERLCGSTATVGRVGPEDIGVIWEDGSDGLKTVKSQIERLSETLGFRVRAGSAEFPRDGDVRDALIEAAARLPEEAAA